MKNQVCITTVTLSILQTTFAPGSLLRPYRAYSEAPVWAKLLCEELFKVTDEIVDVKEQVQVMKDDVNTRINDLFAKTEGAEEKLQGLQLEYEGLRREIEPLSMHEAKMLIMQSRNLTR